MASIITADAAGSRDSYLIERLPSSRPEKEWMLDYLIERSDTKFMNGPMQTMENPERNLGNCGE